MGDTAGDRLRARLAGCGLGAAVGAGADRRRVVRTAFHPRVARPPPRVERAADELSRPYPLQA